MIMSHLVKTSLTICALLIVALPTLAFSSSSKDPIERPSLTKISTAEIAAALAFRGVTVPGHADPAAPWPVVNQFQIKVNYSIKNTNVFAANIFCDLAQPCTFEIPAPKQGGSAVSFSFVHREQLRNELITDKLPPIGLDALRGDAVGLVYNSDNRENPVNPVKDSLLGYWVSTYSTYLRQPNPNLRIVPAAPRIGNRAWRWAISYTHMREHGIILQAPHGAGGVATITVVDGDPAPGVQDYLLPVNSTTQLINALKKRGIKVSTAPHKGRTVFPSRFIVALEMEQELTEIKTGQVIRSDPKDVERAIFCDLTREHCVVKYGMGVGRDITHMFKHPLSLLPSNAILPAPGTTTIDYSNKYDGIWKWFFNEYRGVKSIGSADPKNPMSPQFVNTDDLMMDGIGSLNIYPDNETYKDMKWFLRLRILRLLY